MYYVKQPTSGILKLFEFRPTITAPPAWVPADAGSYFAFDWNLKGAYEAVEAIYDSFTGPGKFAAQVNQLVQQGGLPLHPKTDVIDALSGKLEGYMISPTGDDPKTLQAMVSLGLADKAKGQKLLATVSNLVGGASSDFQGLKVYGPPDADQPGAAAIKDDAVLISFNPEQLKLALTGKPASKPLVRSEAYAEIKKLIPEKVSILTYQNAADQLGTLYEKVRGGDLDSAVEGQFDFSVLPPFETLRKYLTPSAGYLAPDESGAIAVQFSLKRKE
jgi:hypothetical protein